MIFLFIDVSQLTEIKKESILIHSRKKMSVKFNYDKRENFQKSA
jgi:hypothetical protein